MLDSGDTEGDCCWRRPGLRLVFMRSALTRVWLRLFARLKRAQRKACGKCVRKRCAGQVSSARPLHRASLEREVALDYDHVISPTSMPLCRRPRMSMFAGCMTEPITPARHTSSVAKLIGIAGYRCQCYRDREIPQHCPDTSPSSPIAELLLHPTKSQSSRVERSLQQTAWPVRGGCARPWALRQGSSAQYCCTR